MHENNVVHKCPQKVSDNDATRCGGKHVDNGATRCGRSSNAGSSANELHLSTVLVHKNSHTQLTKLIGLCRLPVSFYFFSGSCLSFCATQHCFFFLTCLRLFFFAQGSTRRTNHFELNPMACCKVSIYIK